MTHQLPLLERLPGGDSGPAGEAMHSYLISDAVTTPLADLHSSSPGPCSPSHDGMPLEEVSKGWGK